MDDELPTDIPEACRHPWTMNCLRIPSVQMSEIPGVGQLEVLAMPKIAVPDYINWYYYDLVLLLLRMEQAQVRRVSAGRFAIVPLWACAGGEGARRRSALLTAISSRLHLPGV